MDRFMATVRRLAAVLPAMSTATAPVTGLVGERDFLRYLFLAKPMQFLLKYPIEKLGPLTCYMADAAECETLWFFFLEYDRPWLRSIANPKKKKGHCKHIGEVMRRWATQGHLDMVPMMIELLIVTAPKLHKLLMLNRQNKRLPGLYSAMEASSAFIQGGLDAVLNANSKKFRPAILLAYQLRPETFTAMVARHFHNGPFLKELLAVPSVQSSVGHDPRVTAALGKIRGYCRGPAKDAEYVVKIPDHGARMLAFGALLAQLRPSSTIPATVATNNKSDGRSAATWPARQQIMDRALPASVDMHTAVMNNPEIVQQVAAGLRAWTLTYATGLEHPLPIARNGDDHAAPDDEHLWTADPPTAAAAVLATSITSITKARTDAEQLRCQEMWIVARLALGLDAVLTGTLPAQLRSPIYGWPRIVAVNMDHGRSVAAGIVLRLAAVDPAFHRSDAALAELRAIAESRPEINKWTL
ncbi:hypothetical protein BC828DRAFT_409551 [Blastocladiella britannica]|nr:hypothetical protein BC828DRAFT_409551 [Blastocladiella britannica]